MADFKTIYRRITIVFCCFLGLCIFFGCGFLVGLLRGEQDVYHRRYLEEKELIEPILTADPIFKVVEIHQSSDGGVWLSGQLPALEDRERLRRQLIPVVGKSRVNRMMNALYPKW
jgi:hypothetical protein